MPSPRTRPRTRPRRPARTRHRVARRPPGVLTAIWGVISLIFVVVALLTQIVLFLIAAVLAAVAAGLAGWTEFGDGPATGTGRAGRGGKPPRSAGSGRNPPTGPVIRCTATRTPIETCGCAARHVATTAGATRYGLPVGAPIKPKGRP